MIEALANQYNSRAMSIDAVSGLLNSASYCPSPNCDERPLGMTAELLVIHNISLPPGDFGRDYISQLFTNTLDYDEHPYFLKLVGLKVSAHLLIKREGQIIQFVPFHQRAWHAGVSCYKGREACNDFSIGIELEGTDESEYTAQQYTQLVEVTRALIRCYPKITPSRIVGHSDIAPGRKTDPGASFDWLSYKQQLFGG